MKATCLLATVLPTWTSQCDAAISSSRMIGGRKAGSPLRQMSPRETHGYIFPATPLSISLPKQHREKSAMILKVPQLLNQQRLPVRKRTDWCTVATISKSTYG